MSHFTQLGLSGKPEVPNGKASTAKQLTHKHKTATLVGSLIATALLGVFVFESGCAKESDKTATIATPNQTAASQLPTSISTTSTSMPVASQPPAKKKSRQRKLSASTYTNPAYGVSFRYPKYGNLKQGEQANLDLVGLGPLEMNFIQPGGATISAVELPRKLYAGTNFNTAFFNVSMNPKLTAEQCAQFAFPETTDAADPVVASKTKVGATEFQAVEGFAGEDNNQADVKYYHVFQNGSCYEFALGLETATEAIPDDAKPSVKPPLKSVDRNEVFRRLDWILSTVKIQPIATPEKTAPEVASDTPAASTDAAITEAH